MKTRRSMKNDADKTYKVVINESCHGVLVLSPMAVEWLKQHDFEYRVKPDKEPWEYLDGDSCPIPRHHPLLVECIETLGEKAAGQIDGSLVQLVIKEITGPYYWIGNEGMGEYVIDKTVMQDARSPLKKNVII